MKSPWILLSLRIKLTVGWSNKVDLSIYIDGRSKLAKTRFQ